MCFYFLGVWSGAGVETSYFTRSNPPFGQELYYLLNIDNILVVCGQSWGECRCQRFVGHFTVERVYDSNYLIVGAKRAKIILQKPTINRLSLGTLFEMRRSEKVATIPSFVFFVNFTGG